MTVSTKIISQDNVDSLLQDFTGEAGSKLLLEFDQTRGLPSAKALIEFYNYNFVSFVYPSADTVCQDVENMKVPSGTITLLIRRSLPKSVIDQIKKQVLNAVTYLTFEPGVSVM